MIKNKDIELADLKKQLEDLEISIENTTKTFVKQLEIKDFELAALKQRLDQNKFNDIELSALSQQLEEKESELLSSNGHLIDLVSLYQHMKTRYESLLNTSQQLETQDK